MELQGIVYHIGEEININNSFSERRLVIKTEEQYPQLIELQFTQGKCNSDLDNLKFEQRIKIQINIRGREWINPQGEKKYFNSIQAWKIENL